MTAIEDLSARIDQRLAELVEESERLQRARTALTTTATADRRPPAPARGGPASRGSVRPVVLAALADGKAKTPAVLATETGLRRTTIASTLPGLVRAGEVAKAKRGYRLVRRSRERGTLRELDDGLRTRA